jgi:hypothetical protein
MEKMRNAYKLLIGIPEWPRPFGRSRHRWEDNIETEITASDGLLPALFKA